MNRVRPPPRARPGDLSIPVKCHRIQSRPSDSPPPPPPPPPPGDHKVCVVFQCVSNQQDNMYRIHFNLCFVDLYTDTVVDAPENDEEITHIFPTLQIDAGTSVSIVDFAFCLWNESLFVFEGSDSIYGVGRNQKSIYTYDLQSMGSKKKMVYLHTKKNPGCKKKSKSITKVGDMKSPKVQPLAVPTPDGKKIILLDAELCNTSVFELFDPLTASSETLPMIEDLLSKKGTVQITSHGFATESKFAINIPYCGKFIIDLALPEKGWINLLDADCISYDRKFLFSVIGGQFLLNPDNVIDSLNSCYYPVPSTFVETMDLKYDMSGANVRREAYLTLLEHEKDKGQCDFCVLHSEGRWTSSTTPHCNVTIDVCRALYDNKEKPPRVDLQLKSSRALKLSCHLDGDMAFVSPSAVFSII